MQELEHENNHLGQEHLVMLKKHQEQQEQIVSGSTENKDTSEQSTKDDTAGHITEENQQMVAVRDNFKQQIDLLSNML